MIDRRGFLGALLALPFIRPKQDVRPGRAIFYEDDGKEWQYGTWDASAQRWEWIRQKPANGYR